MNKEFLIKFMKRLHETGRLPDLEGEFREEFNNLSEDDKDTIAFHVYIYNSHRQLFEGTDEQVATMQMMKIAWDARGQYDLEKAKMFYKLNRDKISVVDLQDAKQREKILKVTGLYDHMKKAEKTIKAQNPGLSAKELDDLATEYYHIAKKKFGID